MAGLRPNLSLPAQRQLALRVPIIKLGLQINPLPFLPKHDRRWASLPGPRNPHSRRRAAGRAGGGGFRL